MAILIRKSLVELVELRKSEVENNKLAYFKNELLKILANKKDDEDESVDKSLLFYDSLLEKSGRGLPPGTKKEWPAGSGKWFVKNGKGEWVRTYNGNGRGSAKGMAMSVARMKKAIENAKTTEELLAIVEKNRYKFTDDNGKSLPIVKELMDHVHAKKVSIKGTKKEEDPEQESNLSENDQDKRLGNSALWDQKLKNAIQTGVIEKIKEAIETIRQEYAILSKRTKTKSEKEFLDYELKYRERDAKKAIEDLKNPKPTEVNQENVQKIVDTMSTIEIKRELADAERSFRFSGGTDKESQKRIEELNAALKLALQLDEKKNDKNINDSAANSPDSSTNAQSDKKSASDKNSQESESEKHENRSKAMMGNQNARKYGISDEEINSLREYATKFDLSEMSEHITNGDFGDSIKNGMEQAAKEQGISVTTLLSPLHDKLQKEEKERELKEALEAIPEKVKAKAEEYKKDWYTKSCAESVIRKLGEKKLTAYAEMDLKDDEEYLKDIIKKMQDLEQSGKHIDDYTIGTVIWKHYVNVECKKLAQQKLDSMNANRNDSAEDIPVDEKDMKEAVSIIGPDVQRILDGRDVYGNAKQTLTDKIKRRVRNNPALARAMLVYIQQEQKRTGKKVYTEKHSIWEELPKLNENARQAKESGETETKTGTSGNLYEGEDGTYVVENKDWGRYQIFFPGKPDSGTISTLKHNGFRWSPSTKSWVCFNTGNGEYSLKRVADEIGLKKVDGTTTPKVEPKDETNAEINKELNKKTTFEDIKNHYATAKSVTGNSKTYRLPNGEKIKCHYKLVEADAPTASHDENTYQKTEGFPTDESGSTINDRDYSKDVDAQESVRQIAANYSGLAIQDPPIVTKDGIVVSGNNRTMSSKLAAKNGTDKEYIKDLKEEIEDFGIDPEEMKNFKNPRIILEIDEEHNGPYTTAEFAKFNQDGKKSMNTTEKAVKISKTIKPEVVTDISSTLSDYDTMAEMWQDKKSAEKIMDSLVNGGVIGRNDVAQYYTEESGISEAGKEFVETVLIGSVMNESNIRQLAGAGGKAIRQKLVRGIVPLIDNKGMGNEYSFNSELNEAVRIAVTVMKDREHFNSVSDYLKQGNMFEDKVDPITSKLAEMIEGMTQKDFAEKMKGLNAGLRPAANGEVDIFLGRCETKQEVMNSFLKIKETVQKAINSFMKIFNW